MGAKAPPGDMFLSTLLDGVNMELLRDAVKDCPLAYLFSSRKGLWNEKILAYAQRKNGTYGALSPRTPSAWHLVHADKGEWVLARVLGPLRQGGELDPDFWIAPERAVARHQQTRGGRRCAEKPVGGRLGRLGERRLSRRSQQVLQLLYELFHVLCVFLHDLGGSQLS